jgi:hypothetical protein
MAKNISPSIQLNQLHWTTHYANLDLVFQLFHDRICRIHLLKWHIDH